MVTVRRPGARIGDASLTCEDDEVAQLSVHLRSSVQAAFSSGL